MRIIWQQIIGVLLILITTLMVIAVSIEQLVVQQITDHRQSQLRNYGINIVENDFTRDDLLKASQLLASENISIQVYLPDGEAIYPIHDSEYDAELTEAEFEVLNVENEPIGLRYDYRMNEDNVEELYMIVYFPHNQIADFPPGFMSLAAPLDDFETRLTTIRRSILISSIAAAIAGVILTVIYAIFQTQKIRRLQMLTSEIEKGNFDISIDINSSDEFGDLARDFKSMSDSLQHYKQEVRHQENLRRQFMMDAAHEMRTPLTTMKGLIEGLINDIIPEKNKKRSLELISQETDRLSRLVNENLDYERIRSNQYTLDKKEIDATKLFKSIKEQMKPKAVEKNITFTVLVEDNLTIWADYDRLKQIIINLVSNAIQFSADSEVRITANAVKNGVRIQIIDQGIGISSEDITKIWERFYKADISRKNTKFGESGIGLAIVHSLVEAHQGDIKVESEEGQGSIFTVFLPSKEHISE